MTTTTTTLSRREPRSQCGRMMAAAREEVKVSPLALSPERAAAAINCGRAHLYTMLRTGELRSIRVNGGRRIVPVSELEAWIARQLAAGDAASPANTANTAEPCA